MGDSDYLLGLALFLALFAAILALPVTWLLLRRYRKSVIRLMGQRGSPRTSPPGPAAAVKDASAAKRAVSLEPDVIRSGLRRNLIVVLIAGLLIALAFGTLLFVWNDIEISIYRLAFFTVLDSWPAVIGIWIVTGGARRWVWGSLAVYFAALLATTLIGWSAVDQAALVWVWTLIPTAAIIAFLSRPLRGVGPLVLVAMMFAILGGQAFALTVLGSERLLFAWIDLFLAVGITDGFLIFFGLQVIGFLAALMIGVLVVLALAWWYARRGFSDQMLLLGSTFMVFAIDYSLGVSPTDADAVRVGAAIYLGVAVVAMILYRLIHKPPQDPAALLMLRVFSPDPDSRRLLDRITSAWRYAGPVRMIGGPDLAVANVEANEFLTFVSGRLRTLFIDHPATLEERLRSLNDRPDSDARFRVDEFFCFDDTWRLTVTQLLERSEAVVMDLRAFGPGNQGCIDEIELLATEQALARTVFLVDSRSDRPLLDSVLGARAEGGPAVVAVDDDDPDQAVSALLEAATMAGTMPGGRFH
jgi:hypothetical protein